MKYTTICISLLAVLLMSACNTKKGLAGKGEEKPTPIDSVTDTTGMVSTSPAPIPTPFNKFKDIELAGIDNSRYELRNKHLVIEITGESMDEQWARDICLSNAFDSLKVVISETVQFIIEKRGFDSISINNITVANTKTLKDNTTERQKHSGRTVYRNTQSLQFNIEPILQDLYQRIKSPKGYSRDAFYRDFDYLIEKIK